MLGKMMFAAEPGVTPGELSSSPGAVVFAVEPRVGMLVGSGVGTLVGPGVGLAIGAGVTGVGGPTTHVELSASKEESAVHTHIA